MGQFLNSINEVRKNYSKYDAWEQAQADERAKKEYLVQNIDIPQDKLELTQKRAEAVIRATEIMDARSEDNCENMEQYTSILTMIPILGLSFAQLPLLKYVDRKIGEKYTKKLQEINKSWGTEEYSKNLDKLEKWKIKAAKRGNNYVTYGTMAATLLFAIGAILWGNSKQKEASRIGRYQAKQNELKGVENFVLYTPEQLEKAKEIAKTIPDAKDRNSISKMIKELKEVSKDKKAYKEWLSKKDPQEIEKLKSINILGEERLKKAQEDKELIVDAVKEINIKAEEYSENVENAYDTFLMLSWLAAAPIGFGLNKVLKAFKASPKLAPIVSTAVSIVTPLMIQLIGTMEQKQASRVGRYIAREDLLKNPARLMAFSDEDMKKAENIKADEQKQTFMQKLGSSFSFIKKYAKDKKDYLNYKKTTQKENEKLQKAFKQIKITDAQKIDAEELQKKVFRAFDEIDEMSQRLSEDTEAGCDIAKQVGSTAWTLGSMGALAYLGIAVAKGKFPIMKLANKLTNMSFEANAPIKSAVNNLNDVLKSQGKTKTREFQKALVSGEIGDFMLKPENKAITEAILPIFESFAPLKGAKNIEKSVNDIFKPQLKQTRLAKWTRNMIEDCTNLWAKSKGFEDTKKFSYKNYKTVINTGLVAGIPVLGTIFAVPYAFNAWLTNIQKRAGKIGIMKAMDKIDDPKVFASEVAVSDTAPQSDNENSNLISKFKQSAR